MQYRTPRFNQHGMIDCEIRHPKWGWIPFTVDPDDTGAEFNVKLLDTQIRATGGIAPYEAPPVPPPTNEDVNAERVRRIEAGKVFTLSTGKAITMTGRDEDMRNLMNLALAAQMRMAQNDMTTLTAFRDELNTTHDLAPPELIELWQQGGAYVQAIYAASWTLKDNSAGIPADYAEDLHWPA